MDELQLASFFIAPFMVALFGHYKHSYAQANNSRPGDEASREDRRPDFVLEILDDSNDLDYINMYGEVEVIGNKRNYEKLSWDCTVRQYFPNTHSTRRKMSLVCSTFKQLWLPHVLFGHL